MKRSCVEIAGVYTLKIIILLLNMKVSSGILTMRFTPAKTASWFPDGSRRKDESRGREEDGVESKLQHFGFSGEEGRGALEQNNSGWSSMVEGAKTKKWSWLVSRLCEL